MHDFVYFPTVVTNVDGLTGLVVKESNDEYLVEVLEDGHGSSGRVGRLEYWLKAWCS
jgi:hypothetical protein